MCIMNESVLFYFSSLFNHLESIQIITPIFIVFLSILIWFLSQPVNVKKDYCEKEPNLQRPFYQLTDVNLNHLNEPGPFPNGWIGVCESQYLKNNQIKRFDFCGHRIILLRSSSGLKKPYALDAFCPHLGADFSVGGKIIKKCDTDCIRCPFHGWVFRANDGLCLEVPYTKDKKPPNGVKAKVWKCLELNGFIYVWHHTEDKEPTWFPEPIDEIQDNKWSYLGRSEHIIPCALQEIPENGPDFAHLDVIHGPSFLWGEFIRVNRNWFYDIFEHKWESSWRKGEPPEEHKAFLSLKTKVLLFGRPIVDLKLDRIEQIGPTIVHLFFYYNILWFKFSGVYIQNIVPLGVNKQQLIHQTYAEKLWITPILKQFMVRVEALLVERDISIWRHKIYLTNPKLVKEEKQIAVFRRWYSQFFSQPKKMVQFQDLW